jgi:MoaA/NifB/PqqE/SkfB family radical SAM enzyme
MSLRRALRSIRPDRSHRPAVVPDDRALAPQPFPAACYAAHASMYFDQFGRVRACCQNTEAPMGDISEQTIREIWDSVATQELRDALCDDDYSQGCGFCQWQVDQGDDSIVFARIFDQHHVSGPRPEWPVQMEFSMTNACNLQCVMCNGDWSSSIRTHREGRAPLPEVYGDAFFEELAEFLPHLRKANFLGGEPFLGREPLRVLSMLAELDDPPEVAVTTNGTQWSPRIERICERLPISFVVSLDGLTAGTYESIRVGADHAVVMEHLEHFEAAAERHGTMVTLAHCVMRSNVHEFSALLEFAENRGYWVGINEVLYPADLSLFQLPADDLRRVVHQLEADPIADRLDRLRYVWDGQLDALRNRLAVLETGQAVMIQPWGDAAVRAERWEDRAMRVLAEWVEDETPTRVTIRTDEPAATIDGLHEQTLLELGAEQARSPEQLVELLSDALGAPSSGTGEANLLHDVVIGSDGPGATQIRLTWDDVIDHRTVFVAVRNPPGPPPLPDDPWADLLDTSAPGAIVVLTCDATEVVTDVEGDTVTVLGLEPADLLGQATERILGRVTSAADRVEFGPGPSGREADSTLELHAADGTVRRLRVLVDRGDVVTVAIGLTPASS